MDDPNPPTQENMDVGDDGVAPGARVILVDADLSPIDEDFPRGIRRQREEKIYTIARDHLQGQVTVFKPTDAESLFEFLKQTFDVQKSDDAVIIYFAGDAAGSSKIYKWKLRNGRDYDVDAGQLLQLCVDSGLNILLIFHCHFPDQLLRANWKVSENGTPGGLVELLAAPALGDREDDDEYMYREPNFTHYLALGIRDFAQETFRDPSDHSSNDDERSFLDLVKPNEKYDDPKHCIVNGKGKFVLVPTRSRTEGKGLLRVEGRPNGDDLATSSTNTEDRKRQRVDD